MSKLFGNQPHIDRFDELLSSMEKGKFNVLFLNGEKGTGKSSLLQEFAKICSAREVPLLNILIENEKPLGQFNLSNVSPFKTMEKAVELLLIAKNISAKKKFAINASLTALSAIPLAGDAIWAGKELVKDWKQYKADAGKEAVTIKNTIMSDLFDTFMAKLEKDSFVVMFDDAEWTDPHSIELISTLFNNLTGKKCLFVLAFNDENLTSPSIPLNKLLELDYPRIDLKNLSKENTNLMCKDLIENYPNDTHKSDTNFNEWIFDKTYGNPGLIDEYNQYFILNPPFDKDGKLILNLDDQKLLSSAHIAIAKSLESLTDDEVNLLSAASIEGNEFSVYILSKILEKDILSIIKDIRIIINKTNLVKSIGAHKKYGVKSTMYAFTKSYYSDYFRKNLEYEEYISLNGILASILQFQYNMTEDETEKKQIIPYLAAHLREADSETESIDLISKALEDMDDEGRALINFSTDQLYSLTANNEKIQDVENSNSESSGSNGEESAFDPDLLEFSNYRKIIVKLYNQNKYDKSIEKAKYCIENLSFLSDSQSALLNIFISRSYLELGDLENSYSHLNLASDSEIKDPNIKCLYYIARMHYFSNSGNRKRAVKELQKSAELINDTSDEMKLLVMHNIANNPEMEAQERNKYSQAAINYATELHINL